MLLQLNLLFSNMWCRRKNTTKSLFVFALLLSTLLLNAQQPQINTPKKVFKRNLTKNAPGTDSIGTILKPVTSPAETAAITGDTLPLRRQPDSLVAVSDTFSVNFSKDSLDAPVTRAAIDSAVFLVKQKQFILYGKAKTTYKDNVVEGHRIRLDNEHNLMYAYGKPDSANLRIDEQVKMVTGAQDIFADSIKYDIKSGKGVSSNSRTTSEEMFVTSKVTKMMGDRKTIFGFENLFTTCNLDTPHFAFHAKRIKLINQELAVSGFANPEFEGVPLPIGVPFGIYPLKRGRHSGFLPPQFTTNEQLGVGLEGLGYFKVINDYWDVMVRTNLYSYGSWNLVVTPTYRKRYKYNGSLNINIQNTKQNFKGDADFAQNRSFNIGWSHTADTRARPGVTFSANVNAGKSSFNQFNPNNPFRNTANQMYSSISWSKTWTDKPYNLTISANHNQNTNNQVVNINLPEVGFTVQTLYPFQRKESVGAPKWYEKLGIAYNGNFRSQMAFKDTEPIKEILRTLVDTFQWGATHNIPITLSLPPVGNVQIAPSVSYEERTYGQKIFRQWNSTSKQVDTVINKGLYQARQLSFGLGVSTAIFGTFNFKAATTKKPGVMTIRHVIRPTASIQYKPDMAKKYFYNLQVDTGASRFVRVSVFDGGLYGAFGEGRFGGMSFGIDNNIEMKIRTKDTTGKDGGTKKVKIIDGFGFTSGYNFLADSFQLSPFNIYLRTSFADGKVNVTGGAVLDPYQLQSNGDRKNKFTWEGTKFSLASLGRFTSASLSLSTQFRGGEKKEGKDKKSGTDNPYGNGGEDMTPDEQLRMQEYVRTHPAEFADFNVPWNLGLSVAMNISRVLQPDYSYKTDVFANLNFNGDFNLTKKWKVGANGFYDLKTLKVQQFQMFISREMHCWQMSINVVPVGSFRSFNISISPKAGMLRDLRINRSRFFYGD
jgi:LPS-assembly protein